MASTLPTLALCMIVRNEEKLLDNCLRSVAGLVDEMVIVDCYSTDRTVEIARRYGARVVEYAWQDNFALARNEGLALVRSDWVLALDADEELEPGSRERIKPLLAQTPADGLVMIHRNLTPPGDLVRYNDLSALRLFRNRMEYRWEGMIHERISPSIYRQNRLVQTCDLIILHYGLLEKTVQGAGSRAERNLGLLLKAVEADPADAYLRAQLGLTYKTLGQNLLAQQHLLRAVELGKAGFGPELLANIYFKLAQLALEGGDQQNTLRYARLCLDLDPNNIMALYLMALAHMERGEVRQAYPFFAQIRRQPGGILANEADLDDILAYCRQFLGVQGGF